MIIRGAAGFYTVRDEAGREYTCRARGKLRRQRGDLEALLVGDRVFFDPEAEVVEEVRPRTNCLLRPPVANVDQAVLVVSVKEPEPDWVLVARQLVAAESAGITALICLNKADLASAAELEALEHCVRAWPYRAFTTSALHGRGLAELREALSGCCSVLAGPSGVGKSTLLNALQPGLGRATGAVSGRIKRGRHTTRTAELMPLPGGGLAIDTPGFSRLELHELCPEALADCFPEMSPFRPECRFRNCRHLLEPACAVRRAVDEGKIDPVRYAHYRLFLEELAGDGIR